MVVAQAGSRARRNGRKVPAATGIERRLYRVKRGDSWEPCDARTQNRKIDSICHRYHRVVGFQGNISDAERETLPLDSRLLEAYNRFNSREDSGNSHPDKVAAQSRFELYALEYHPTHPYSEWLKARSLFDVEERASIPIMAPSEIIVVSYIYFLRGRDEEEDDNGVNGAARTNVTTEEGRQLKYASIVKHIACISGVLLDFHGGCLIRSSRLVQLLEDFEKSDISDRAPAFDPQELLPKLWEVLFNPTRRGELKWDDEKRREMWTKFLFQFCTMSRSSDVSWSKKEKNCPVIGDCAFPRSRQQQLHDGTIMYIEVSWRRWKGRKANKVNKKHKVNVYCNPLNPMYDALHWLQLDWKIRFQKLGGNLDEYDPEIQATWEKEPILPQMTSKVYQANMKELFTAAGFPDFSSHSVRRAAAQWAARCGATAQEIRDVGRWEDIRRMGLYLAEGQDINRKRRQQCRGRDPIVDFWVFDRRTAQTSMDTEANRLDT